MSMDILTPGIKISKYYVIIYPYTSISGVFKRVVFYLAAKASFFLEQLLGIIFISKNKPFFIGPLTFNEISSVSKKLLICIS